MSTIPAGAVSGNDAESVVLTNLKLGSWIPAEATHLYEPLSHGGFYHLICLALTISTGARLP
jgi:hypothetical protein